LDLFVKLEAAPLHQRDTNEFKVGERRLARLLGLTDEFWTMNSVLDRSARPCHPPPHVAWNHWHRCRAAREVLLEAAAAADGVSDQA
jgi:hypothetical protein